MYAVAVIERQELVCMRERLKFVGHRCVAVLAATVALLAWSAHADQVSGEFNVKVTVTLSSPTDPTLPKSAFCRTSPALAFGALVTVVCATGEVVDITAPALGIPWAPLHGGAYRFILPGSYAAGLPDLFDGYTGYGTAASWRVIRLTDRDYYELLVGW